MRFTLTTLGCKVNQYDGCAIATALRGAGLRSVEESACADVVVINTCCVTATAMAKSRQAIRRSVRAADDPAVLIVGCYGDYDADRLAAMLAEMGIPAEKTAIIGHHNDLAKSLDDFLRRISPVSGDGSRPEAGQDPSDGGRPSSIRSPATIRTRRQQAVKRNPPARELGPIDRFDGRQRAFVKVQDGCDAFCTYCIVPFTRPRVSWRPVDRVVAEARQLVAAGHREIVLCGVCLGAYGRDTTVRNRAEDQLSALPALVEAVASLDGLWRVRLSSLEPADLTDELVAVCAASPAVAPHFHLPLQSGSDAILTRMNRQYSADDFRRSVERLRAAFDRPAVTTDVIVGFPGESDADFDATLAMARAAQFAKIHAFPFSAIEGTAAHAWRDRRPPDATVKRRLASLADLERTLATDYRQQFVGQTLQGLIESPRPTTTARQAMTDRYLTIFFTPDATPPAALTGQLATFQIDSLCDQGLTGHLIAHP
ncbi:hypothetical protein LCGC14_0125010 [marine sediment metagenome]|uniref:Uncharacterized protein n=1 Tax=marine sediment metagenome TaxID=412755 RepID=A0A0F9XMV8_9ZZZZ|nr:MiaB/RimO family radical SAM methylthiotransferase [Phycisphaerae bacterium]HDZ45335.1 MiaB/RimO family radical SAM methylthiotransferase [Phycisphaerae bacterium]